jgi:hypothetical protein
MPRLLLAAGAAVILVALTGCIDPTPRVTESPTPSATPVFASEEEALAAAEEAYAAYLKVSDEISADGGANPERLADHVTPDELERAEQRFGDLESSGRRTEGMTVFDSTSIQRFDDIELAVYLCLDVEGVRVLNDQGQDVTPLDRPDRIPLEVTFEVNGRKSLLLESSDVWEGTSICTL